MKLRTYKVYWIEHYPPIKNGNDLQLPEHKKIIGILSGGVVKIEASKEILATNIDELIDILRETMVDEGFDVFTVVNPEGINILTQNDLINRR